MPKCYWLGLIVSVSELVIKKHTGRNGDTESCIQRTALYLSIYVFDKTTQNMVFSYRGQTKWTVYLCFLLLKKILRHGLASSKKVLILG